MGGGYYSTPIVSAFANVQRREAHTIETGAAAYELLKRWSTANTHSLRNSAPGIARTDPASASIMANGSCILLIVVPISGGSISFMRDWSHYDRKRCSRRDDASDDARRSP